MEKLIGGVLGVASRVWRKCLELGVLGIKSFDALSLNFKRPSRARLKGLFPPPEAE